MDEIIIRPGAVTDAAQVALHRRVMFADIRPYESAALDEMQQKYAVWVEEKLAAGEYVAFFALNGAGEIVGGAGAWLREWLFSPRNMSGKDAHVVDVYVRPEYRRRGIARALMQTLVNWCEEHGLVTITLEASDQGQHLYETLGFEVMNMMRKRIPVDKPV